LIFHQWLDTLKKKKRKEIDGIKKLKKLRQMVRGLKLQPKVEK